MILMIKNVIKPFQEVLLNKRMCPGCTHPLDKLEKVPFRKNKMMVQCKCKRRYILDLDINAYRRATFEEEQEFLNKRADFK